MFASTSGSASGSGTYQSSKKFTINGTNKCGSNSVKWIGTFTVTSSTTMSFTYEFIETGCGCSDGQTGNVTMTKIN